MGVKLKKLNNAVFFLGDLIKLATPKLWFIDNKGLIFQYTKSRKIRLQFKKIKAIHPIKAGGAVIEVYGIASRFKCLYIPTKGETFAGILMDGLSPILYGLYTEQHTDTWRMI